MKSVKFAVLPLHFSVSLWHHRAIEANNNRPAFGCHQSVVRQSSFRLLANRHRGIDKAAGDLVIQPPPPPITTVRTRRCQGSTNEIISSILYGGTGVIGYAMGLKRACTLPALSQDWLFSLPIIALSSYSIARSLLPFAITTGRGIDVSDSVFSRNLGAHLFSATAIPILSSLMLPLLNQVQQVRVLFVSMGLMTMGSISEVLAHFKDGWVFGKGCRALDGLENAIFWVGLCGAFSFLSAAFSPTAQIICLAGVPPALLTYLGATKPWHEVKGPTIATQTITTIVACAVFIRRFRSTWPLLFFAQSFNIVRNSSRIIASKNQNLHLLPSAYGWFSYVIPFALSLHPLTRSASLFIVLSSSAVTIIGTDILERRIIRQSEKGSM